MDFKFMSYFFRTEPATEPSTDRTFPLSEHPYDGLMFPPIGSPQEQEKLKKLKQQQLEISKQELLHLLLHILAPKNVIPPECVKRKHHSRAAAVLKGLTPMTLTEHTDHFFTPRDESDKSDEEYSLSNSDQHLLSNILHKTTPAGELAYLCGLLKGIAATELTSENIGVLIDSEKTSEVVGIILMTPPMLGNQESFVLSQISLSKPFVLELSEEGEWPFSNEDADIPEALTKIISQDAEKKALLTFNQKQQLAVLSIQLLAQIEQGFLFKKIAKLYDFKDPEIDFSLMILNKHLTQIKKIMFAKKIPEGISRVHCEELRAFLTELYNSIFPDEAQLSPERIQELLDQVFNPLSPEETKRREMQRLSDLPPQAFHALLKKRREEKTEAHTENLKRYREALKNSKLSKKKNESRKRAKTTELSEALPIRNQKPSTVILELHAQLIAEGIDPDTVKPVWADDENDNFDSGF